MSGKLIVSTFLSLDGIMQGPGGPGEDDSNGFKHGGWLVPHFDEGAGRIMADQFERADALLLGRRSYDILSAHWPNVTGEEGAKINSMPKYVASRSLEKADWNNTVVLSGEAGQTVADLKARAKGEILMQGSGDLIRTLREHDLVDEYRLLIFPVVLGEGKRLFPEGAAPSGLKLVESTTTSSGVVYSVYEQESALTYGTVTLDG